MRDTNEEYWGSYDGLQNAKHSILRNYLNAWFPILTSQNGSVLYIDCNAGRGRHKEGQEGSPIIALNCLLNHRFCDRILSRAKVNFLFFETEECNVEPLEAEIQALGQLPQEIHHTLICKDYEKQLSEALDQLEANDDRLVPTFAFVDPYGFMLSMDLLNRLLNSSRCELFINLMYRFIDMNMRHASQEANMNNLFGTSDWRYLLEIQDPEKRFSATVGLFGGQLNAQYVTHMTMRGRNNAVKYALIHATNHQTGREKMKEAIWSFDLDGTFTAHERDDPNQLTFLGTNPDLRSLETIIWETFSGKKASTQEIYNVVSDTLYLKKHIHEILRDYRNSGTVPATGYTGPFAFKKNPLFEFPDNRPQ